MGCDGYLKAGPSKPVTFKCYTCNEEVREDNIHNRHSDCDWIEGVGLTVNVEFPDEYWER